MAAVEFDGVSKSFDRVLALQDLNLRIKNGEFFVLVGASGSGKTTTLRLLAGLERPTTGNVVIGETIVNAIPPSKRDIAMVFQSYALYPHMTVRQNLEYGLKRRKVGREDIRSRVEKATKRLRIEDLMNRYPGQLSGGQAQRVAVCRAIVRAPAVFLMDEPLSSLDAQLRSDARAEIKALQAETEITTVYVTHDQVEALTMGDRIGVMNDGRLVQCGTPAEIYHRPINSFVAGFIGSPRMNLLCVKRWESGVECCCSVAGRTVVLGSLGVEHGMQVGTLGIRPEHVVLKDGEVSEGWIDLGEGVVRLIEDLGREYLLHVDIGDDGLLRCLTPSSRNVELGLVVDLVLWRAGIHLFGVSGERILQSSELERGGRQADVVSLHRTRQVCSSTRDQVAE